MSLYDYIMSLFNEGQEKVNFIYMFRGRNQDTNQYECVEDDDYSCCGDRKDFHTLFRCYPFIGKFDTSDYIIKENGDIIHITDVDWLSDE